MERVAKPILQILVEEGCRLFPSGRISALDVIERRKTKHAATELKRLRARVPELDDKLILEQLPHRQGQRPTSTIAPEDLEWFLRLLSEPLPSLGRAPKTRPRPPLVAVVASHVMSFSWGEKPAPYGWRWDEDILSPVQSEQRVVKYVKKLRAFKERYADIVAALQRDDILPRPGEAWTEAKIEELLRYDHEPHWAAFQEHWRRWRAYVGAAEEDDVTEEQEGPQEEIKR